MITEKNAKSTRSVNPERARAADSGATRQGLDPASGVSFYPTTVLMVLLAIGWAVLVTVTAGPPTPAVPALAALILLVAAGYVVVRQANPLRAPFTVRTHVAVHGMLVVACLIGAGVNWGTDDLVRVDWVPTSLGLLVVGMGSYRPARELGVFSVVSATFVALATVIGVAVWPTTAPAPVSIVIAVTPLLALGLGTAMYTREIIAALEDWYRRSGVASAALADELRDGIARSVQQDRVTILSRDVSPFFARLLEHGSITPEDRVAAAEIAESLRSVMVADADRSWLETLLTLTRRSGHPFDYVDDPDRIASHMTHSQRTALRAFVVALDDGIGEIGRVAITLRLVEGLCTAVLAVSVETDEHILRRHTAPYFAVMRAAFAGLSTEFRTTEMIVRFSYDPA